MANNPANREAADWKFIYIAEAHAMDEWPIRSGRFNRGRGPIIIEKQPSTSEERCQLAKKFAEDFDLKLDIAPDNVEFLVDVCERQDPFERAYAPWPLRLYLIRDGALQWIAQPKQCSYDDAVAELVGRINLKTL